LGSSRNSSANAAMNAMRASGTSGRHIWTIWVSCRLAAQAHFGDFELA
jgi:hypothetical protein